jgi:hypothetical protein
MTKRRLGREIEELSDEVLAELEPVERSRYLHEFHVQGKDYWVERLFDTCPPEEVIQTVVCGQVLLQFALEAVYNLHTTALQFDLFETKRWARILTAEDETPPEEELERAADQVDRIRSQFANLYIGYHGNRRFAEEELGIEFETWVGICENGPQVLKLVEHTLDNSLQRRLATEWVVEDAELSVDELDDDPLDVLVDNWYEHHLEKWQRLVTEPDRMNPRYDTRR